VNIRQPGETFIDRMIALVEGANRHKTPNEIALEHPARSAQIISCSAGRGHHTAADGVLSTRPQSLRTSWWPAGSSR